MTVSGLGEGTRRSTWALFSLTKKHEAKQFILLSAADIKLGAARRVLSRRPAQRWHVREMAAGGGTAAAPTAAASALRDLRLQERRMRRNRLGGLLVILNYHFWLYQEWGTKAVHKSRCKIFGPSEVMVIFFYSLPMHRKLWSQLLHAYNLLTSSLTHYRSIKIISPMHSLSLSLKKKWLPFSFQKCFSSDLIQPPMALLQGSLHWYLPNEVFSTAISSIWVMGSRLAGWGLQPPQSYSH